MAKLLPSGRHAHLCRSWRNSYISSFEMAVSFKLQKFLGMYLHFFYGLMGQHHMWLDFNIYLKRSRFEAARWIILPAIIFHQKYFIVTFSSAFYFILFYLAQAALFLRPGFSYFNLIFHFFLHCSLFAAVSGILFFS